MTNSSPSNDPRIAVLGTGRQLHAFSAYLGSNGYDVSVVSREPEIADAIATEGGIAITGLDTDFVEIDPENATTDVAAGIRGRDLVIVADLAADHEYFFEELSGHLEDGQTIFIGTDNYGCLKAHNLLDRSAVDIRIAGSSQAQFTGRSHEPGTVNITGMKSELPIAAIPATDTRAAQDLLNPLFDPDTHYREARNVFELNLSNLNVAAHTVIGMFNLTHMDRGDDWLFYSEGITPAVERLFEAFDEERLELASKLDVDTDPIPTIVDNMYDEVEGETLMELLGESPIHRESAGPKTLEYRYITEDVPYGLVPLASLCHEIGISCPTFDALVHLYSVGTGRAFREEGTTVDDLGLQGLSAAEMLSLVEGKSGE